jgi:hypothetical protein
MRVPLNSVRLDRQDSTGIRNFERTISAQISIESRSVFHVINVLKSDVVGRAAICVIDRDRSMVSLG